MQRFACLALAFTAACGGGSATGEASLSGVQPPVKAAASEPFVGPDGSGQRVMGWSILLYADEPGGDCLEGKVVGKIGIFTTQAEGSAPQALLSHGPISIVTDSPPVVAGQATANMGVEGVSNVMGQVIITDFHLTPDAMHADRIEGMITAGGFGPNQEGVSLTGEFVAPICEE